MNYTIKIADAKKHFIEVTATVSVQNRNEILFQLPAWRPGRYQLANYAKNIRKFTVLNQYNDVVEFIKITKDCWRVISEGCTNLKITYEYYANQLDAGASYCDNDLLYINPVNCLVYYVNAIDSPCELTLLIPDDYKIACQLKIEGKKLLANNYHQLADSPFIASSSLFHHSFNFGSSKIHFWIHGKNPFDKLYLKQLEDDTIAYAELQKNIFGEFPCTDYHFMYFILPYKFRHGVEHEDSTVITMGFTNEDILPEFYDDLLAISSHEMFHLWNVKRLRPAQMWPYDYTKENYSSLGYIYEGVTTYYGDLALLRSGVWSFDTYIKSLENDFERHHTNQGRNNYSVAQSSFDTWLDGYEPGIEGRKVSIYTEGCIAALIADITILAETKGKKRLDDVLKHLYNNTFKQNKGYTDNDYKNALEEVSGLSFNSYFNDIINGCGMWDEYINEALSRIGLEITLSEALKPKITINKNATAIQKNLLKVWSNENLT
ncbi:MAG: M61 family metallopeptidase [Bacteroidia bacterium]